MSLWLDDNIHLLFE